MRQLRLGLPCILPFVAACSAPVLDLPPEAASAACAAEAEATLAAGGDPFAEVSAACSAPLAADAHRAVTAALQSGQAGIVRAADAQAAMLVPAAALPNDMRLSIRPLRADELPTPPPGETWVGPAYELGTAGARFAVPLRLAVRMPAAALAAAEGEVALVQPWLVSAGGEQEALEEVELSPTADGGAVVVAMVPHFSTLAFTRSGTLRVRVSSNNSDPQPVGDPFEVRVHASVMGTFVSARYTSDIPYNRSNPVAGRPLGGSITLGIGGDGHAAEGAYTYACNAAGSGRYTGELRATWQTNGAMKRALLHIAGPVHCADVDACIVDGVRHPNGSTWQTDPCTWCSCDASVVHCAIQDCAEPPCENPVSVPGSCCPVCPSCEDLAGIDFGPCDAVLGSGVVGGACTTISGCSSPVPLFPTSEACQRACAPDCIDPSGQVWHEGDTWNPDPCTYCSCSAGQIACAMADCAPPPCSDPVWRPGQCCPVCPTCVELSGTDFGPCDAILGWGLLGGVCTSISGCSSQVPLFSSEAACQAECSGGACVDPSGQIWQSGDTWNPDACTFCSCDASQISCAIADCAFPPCANPVVLPGQCCPVCPSCEDLSGTDFGPCDAVLGVGIIGGACTAISGCSSPVPLFGSLVDCRVQCFSPCPDPTCPTCCIPPMP